MSANTFLPPSPVAPPFLNITDITNERFATVTTDTANGYVVGQLLHFEVPSDFGMFQINQQTAQIRTVDATNLIFTIDLDTTQYDVFTIPVGNVEKPATMSSGGSRNLYNISYVPFHAINGSFGN